MNELAPRQQEAVLAISTETKKLIQSSIADSTLKRYQQLSKQIEAWFNGQVLNNALLADYITEFHIEGKSSATIAQVVAAAKPKQEGYFMGRRYLCDESISITGGVT